MNKKFIASVLAVTMLVGMSAPVMADTAYTEKNYGSLKEITVSGNAEAVEPSVKITVPTNSNFVIDPYKSPIKSDLAESLDLSADVLASISDNQIISRTSDLKNDSDVNIAVTIKDFFVKTNGHYETDAKRVVDGKVSGNYVAGWPITVTSSKVSPTKKATKRIFLQMVLTDGNGKTVKIKGKSDKKYTKKNGEQPVLSGATKNRAVVIKKGATGTIKFDGSVNETPVKYYKQDGKKGKQEELDLWDADDSVGVEYKIILTPTTLTK